MKRWTGTTWVPLGDAFIYHVNALEGFGGELYAGGVYSTGQRSTELRRLVKWNGQHWVEVAQGLNNSVTALLATPTGLVVGGYFTALGAARSLTVAPYMMAVPSASLSVLHGSLSRPLAALRHIRYRATSLAVLTPGRCGWTVM